MRVFRLTRARYPGFDGRGSLLASGRWNHAGARIVYASAWARAGRSLLLGTQDPALFQNPARNPARSIIARGSFTAWPAS
jgi:hypothetical protein